MSLSASQPLASDIVLDQVSGDMIAAAWPHIEPLLQKGIDQVATEQTTAAILAGVGDSRYQLWAIYRKDEPLPLLAAAATYVRQSNKGPVAVIDTIGGRDLSQWFDAVLDRFIALAKEHGITRIQIDGRPGWARQLTGFRKVRVTMERTI